MVDLSQLQVIKTDQDIEKDNQRVEAVAYLRSTDWYVLRMIETGKEIPEVITENRKNARLTISS